MSILPALLLALLLTACNGDKDTLLPIEEMAVEEPGTPITLAAEVEGATTRSGMTGSIDYSALSHCGFGVFANSSVDGWTNWNNTPVTYEGEVPAPNLGPVYEYPGNWTYGEQKYWKKDANSGPIDFFAYAPYVAETGGTGITGVSPQGPSVTYTIATTPDECVDLLWGINSTTGLPWKGTTLEDTWRDNTPESTAGPVLFTFRHALAAIGFHVQAMVDKVNDKGNLEDESNVENLLGTESAQYKITIEEISINGTFHKTNTLLLDNTTPNTPAWGTPSGSEANTSLTVGSSLITDYMRHANVDTATGVTQEAQQLLITKNANDAEQLFFVIPNATPQTYTINIKWYVNHWNNSSNSYTPEEHNSTITVSELTLEPGTKYYFNLVFNLKTVKFSVDAEDWTGETVPVSILTERGTSASSSLARRVPSQSVGHSVR